MNFLRALFHPDEEELELGERGIVIAAANVLQVGEFQLLQLAYREWHGENLPEAQFDALFRSYMLHYEVPIWARHYARGIVDRWARGEIDDREPDYHTYDVDYYTSFPRGARRFALTVAGLILVLGTALMVAEMTVVSSTSILPPYFESSELRPPEANMIWGRADELPRDAGPVIPRNPPP